MSSALVPNSESVCDEIVRQMHARHGGDAFFQAMLNVPELVDSMDVLRFICLPRGMFTTKHHYLVLDGELAADRPLVHLFARYVQGLHSPHADLSTGSPADWIVVVAAVA